MPCARVHLTLYHDTLTTATTFTCRIGTCTVVSHSVEGFRTHMRSKHRDDWYQEQLKRNSDTLALLSPVTPEPDSESPVAVIDHIDKSSNTVSFHQVLQEKLALFLHNMAIRLHMYVDDFEVCNPIGSRRSVHKLTAIYFVVGNVPRRYWSQAPGIYLALLARCKVS